jgi:hypothetical protein
MLVLKCLMDQVANTAHATVGKTLFMQQDVYKSSIWFGTSRATFILILVYFGMV